MQKKNEGGSNPNKEIKMARQHKRQAKIEHPAAGCVEEKTKRLPQPRRTP